MLYSYAGMPAVTSNIATAATSTSEWIFCTSGAFFREPREAPTNTFYACAPTRFPEGSFRRRGALFRVLHCISKGLGRSLERRSR